MYLRGCKYSLEKVKKKIDMWHTVRTHCPDLFDGWSYKDAKMKELIHAGYSINDLDYGQFEILMYLEEYTFLDLMYH